MNISPDGCTPNTLIGDIFRRSEIHLCVMAVLLRPAVKQFIYRHIQNLCDCENLLVSCNANLPFQLGIAGGIDVAAQCLHLGDEILLRNPTLLTQLLDTSANDIGIAICSFSEFNLDHRPLLFSYRSYNIKMR